MEAILCHTLTFYLNTKNYVYFRTVNIYNARSPYLKHRKIRKQGKNAFENTQNENKWKTKEIIRFHRTNASWK